MGDYMFKELFLLFVFGSIIGTIYETILTLVRNYNKYKCFKYDRRCGYIFGPFNPVYGVGAVIFVLLLKSDNILINFLMGSVIGGVYEFIASYIQEKFTGTIGWNYSKLLLNIDGRTTIPFMFFWGFASILLTHFIYPKFLLVLSIIPYLDIIFMFFWVIIIIDTFITFSALIRSKYRRNNILALTFIGRFCDKYYSDEKLKKYFPNLVFVK